MMPVNTGPLLKVENLEKHFKAGRHRVRAVNGVSFEIRKGETYGLVGESGSGKSTIGRTIARLYDPTGGRIEFHGQDLSGKLDAERTKLLRTRMQMIFQDPSASLNPRKKVMDIILEGPRIHRLVSTSWQEEELLFRVLDKVGLSRSHIHRYPHQFSGGQRQRIGIARALIMNPDLIIADEAISALDVSIQAQIVNLLKDIQEETGTAILFISHDLSMVKYLSHRIGVLHQGYLVETGTADEIFHTPVHPYTKALLSAIPSLNPERERKRTALGYDRQQAGIDYSVGEMRKMTATHSVLATEREFYDWTGIPVDGGL